MRSFLMMIFSAITIAFSIFTPFVSINAQIVNVNLSIGSRGAQVTLLQEFLVSKGYLQMLSGVPYGYFGPLTRGAVAQWQAVNGITPAAGYFGPISRAAFSREVALVAPIHPSAPVPAAPITPPVAPKSEMPDTLAAPGMRINRVMLFRAHPFEVRPGDIVTLDGSGFSRTVNRISFNGSSLVTASSTNGSILKIAVPDNLSAGEYRLSVSNVLGTTDDPSIKVAIKVTNTPQPAPLIERASISGDTVTLVGSGFTAANNLITTLGNSPGPISANGSTLIFRITDLSMYDKIRQFTAGGYQMALWIYVENEHGINAEPYKLETII